MARKDLFEMRMNLYKIPAFLFLPLLAKEVFPGPCVFHSAPLTQRIMKERIL